MQFAILDTCSKGRMDTVTELRRAIPVDPASISRHVSVLADRGLLRRIRQQHDRRVVRLELTQEARALMPQLVQALREIDPLTPVGLEDEEKRVFLSAMAKIQQNLESRG